MNVPAAKSQISVFVISSIGASPIGPSRKTKLAKPGRVPQLWSRVAPGQFTLVDYFLCAEDRAQWEHELSPS
jgi:hypothetical protein